MKTDVILMIEDDADIREGVRISEPGGRVCAGAWVNKRVQRVGNVACLGGISHHAMCKLICMNDLPTITWQWLFPSELKVSV